jgi:transposase
MSAIKYKVKLTNDEKLQLEALLHKGKSAARSQTRARILLKAAAGFQDKDIIQALDVSPSMVAKTRQRCVEEGPEAALKDRPRPGQATKLTDKQAAHVIAIACSAAPEGHEHWTLRLLANKVVELSYAPSFSYETIRQLLKKHSETLAEAGVVHSRGECRVRRGHGRRAGSLRGVL